MAPFCLSPGETGHFLLQAGCIILAIADLYLIQKETIPDEQPLYHTRYLNLFCLFKFYRSPANFK